jgi:hypothetical protein
MRRLLLPLAALLLSATAAADPARDTLLVDAAAVPRAGTVRLGLGGGASGGGDTAGTANLGASVLYAFLPGLAAGLSGYSEGGAFSPSATLRWQLLEQDSQGVNLAALVRYKSVGFVPSAAEVEASLNVGRTLGRFELLADGVFGKGIRGDTGADVEGKLSAGWNATEAVRLGADARLQAELADDEASPSPGRDFDLLAGPTASVVIQSVQLQALAGVAAPRRSLAVGPAAMALASIDF